MRDQAGPVTPMASTTVCTENDVKLEGGSVNSEGDVQICHNNTLRPVYDDGLETDNNGSAFAGVVCRQLGYATGASVTSQISTANFASYWLDEVVCTGTEAHLGECTHAGWGVENCSFTERASVRCTVAASGLTATPGDTQMGLAWDAPGNDAGITRHEVRYNTTGSYPAPGTTPGRRAAPIPGTAPALASPPAFSWTGSEVSRGDFLQDGVVQSLIRHKPLEAAVLAL